MKVVVVGAGVAGLSIGWRLAEAGAEAIVLDRAQPGQGATWAAAGMIAPMAEMGPGHDAEAGYAARASALWPAFAAAVEQASGRTVGYRKSGSLLAAMTQADLHAHPGLAALDAAAARALEPMLAPGIAGAFDAPDEAHVDSRALALALAAAFERAGGRLAVNETVIRIENENGKALAVCSPFRLHHADAFVLAAGAWTARIEGLPPEAVPPVRPVKGEMLALAPPDGAALPERMVWGNGVYLVPRGGRLLLGATVEEAGFDTSITDKAADWLLDRAVALMPALARWRIADHWAGLRPASPDGLPMIGPSPLENLYVATGQYRNGILFAPAMAEDVARMVLEGSRARTPFDPRRFAGAAP